MQLANLDLVVKVDPGRVRGPTTGSCGEGGAVAPTRSSRMR